MFVWAGSKCRSDIVDAYNIFDLAWTETRQLNFISECLDSMAIARDGTQKMYSFGGQNGDSKRINSIYSLDFSSLECEEIRSTNPPSPRAHCRMVFFDKKLVVYGGRTNDGVSSVLYLFSVDNSKNYRHCLALGAHASRAFVK